MTLDQDSTARHDDPESVVARGQHLRRESRELAERAHDPRTVATDLQALCIELRAAFEVAVLAHIGQGDAGQREAKAHRQTLMDRASEYAALSRQQSHSPEAMLVMLKGIFAGVAPQLISNDRDALTRDAITRAISAYYGT